MGYTDQEIIEMMKQNREQGAVALLEKYTGLVWNVCARRLENPEDIRECVNTAFAEFCVGFDRFCTETDPDEATPMNLKGYLCTIASRKAANQYRSNLRRAKAEEAALQGQDTFQKIQDREKTRDELVDAMECLEPLDSQIIRMKYYGGLSYQEIAGQLGMNYETVKKRGQRSLKKLWKILIFGLIFLLLTACAVALYRRFQFVEGIGFNWQEELPVYRLTLASPACTANGITFFVDDTIYQDGLLYFALGIRFQAPEDDLSKRQELYQLSEKYLDGMEINGEPAEFIGRYSKGPDSNDHITEIRCHWQPENGKEPLSLQVSLGNQDGAEPAPAFTLELSRVDGQEDISSLGTVYQLEDTGFLATPGIRTEDGTEFSLYVLSAGLRDGTYRFSPLLVDNYKGTDGRKPEKVTLIGEGGTVHESVGIHGRSIMEMERITLRFPWVEPGEYLLSIPYLCMDGSQETDTVFLRLPTEIGESLPCDETILFPDGTGIHLTAITVEQYREEDMVQVGNTYFSADGEWWYRLNFEPVSKEDLHFCVAAAKTVFFCQDLSPGEREAALYAEEDNLPEGLEPICTGGTALGGGEIRLHVECAEPPTWVRLTLTEPVYILEQEIKMRVLVVQ